MTDADEFENEVRRVARLRWPAAQHGGRELLGGRERDGVYVTEECVHLLECTTSRTLEKARSDLAKLFQLYKELKSQQSERAIKCWFITREEPTADQRNARKGIKGAPENLFNVVSYNQFRSSLIDSHEYLQCREKHKFGSVCDPVSGNVVADLPYIKIGLRISGSGEASTIADLAARLEAGKRLSVVGEYGIGKSMALRELFRCLAGRHKGAQTLRFPIYLNLREHQGQQEPAEILERHGRNIGFVNPSQLVRAWKAGFAILLIDGFDEVASMGLQGAWRRLRDARYASMTGVRRLITESPTDVGIAIAGRDNFFDTAEERGKALGQQGAWADVALDDFGESQIKQLAIQLGFSGNVPSWVPSRPLLLATLFGRGIIRESPTFAAEDPAAGWDLLLDEVCNREARIESGVSGENVRAILETLATLARAKDGGLGPLAQDDIIRVFHSECGFQPTDEALIVLQRLPGLGRDSAASDDSRAFVDEEFADVCRAGEFVQFCLDPFSYEGVERLTRTITPIGPTGAGVAAMKLRERDFAEGRLTATIKAIDKHSQEGATIADLVDIAGRLGLEIKHPLFVSNLSLSNVEVESGRPDLSRVTYDGCFIDRLDLPDGVSSSGCPRFQECFIQEIDGRVSAQDLPDGAFSGCIIENYAANAATTSGSLDLEIPIGAKVLITILKKLFVQSVSGRKENALYRGLNGVHQGKVPYILDMLKSHGFIESITRQGEPIWIPVRRNRARVLAILDAPTKSTDAIVQEARKI